MEAKKFFLLYVLDAVKSRDAAKRCEEELVALGCAYVDLSAENINQSLKDADYLICFASSQDELSARPFEDAWRYYDNELSWKRKTSGEIILVLDGEVSRFRLPFRLRNRKTFTQESFDVAKILSVQEGVAEKTKPVPQKPVQLKVESHARTDSAQTTYQNNAGNKSVTDANTAKDTKEKFPKVQSSQPSQQPSDSSAKASKIKIQIGTPYAEDDDEELDEIPSSAPYVTYEDGRVKIKYRSGDNLQSDDGHEYDPFSFDSHKPSQKKTENNHAGLVIVFVFGLFIFFAVISFITDGGDCSEFFDSFVRLILQPTTSNIANIAPHSICNNLTMQVPFYNTAIR